ncbi:MAG: serine hydroxymethyltransferase [Hellea sp.]
MSGQRNTYPEKYFTEKLNIRDPEVYASMFDELERQKHEIELIASENIVSQAVLEAQGSVLTNKYAEGYPGKRYYGGCHHVDVTEQLAIDRVCQLFNCGYANVQPNSGSQANQGVFLALLKPGDTILGMDLASGGHLTHGAPPNLSGKWFNAVSYGVTEDTNLIDYNQVEALAIEHRPKIIICGGSAYSRHIDFKRFRDIANQVGAYLHVDMAHFSGLVAGGVHPSPFPYADVVTSTTHKTLRGPRGGIILTNDPKLAKKFNSAIFPGLQGGPLMHVIAAKAVAFRDALQPEFKEYTKKVIENCKAMAKALEKAGYAVVTGGTDTHLALIDLSPKGVKGNLAEKALGRAYITCNKNGIPFDKEKFTITSGIRIGSPAGTTRGFGVKEFKEIGELMVEILDSLVVHPDGNEALEDSVRERVKSLTAKFPIY